MKIVEALIAQGLDLTAIEALRRTAREVDPRRAGPAVAKAVREGRPLVYIGLVLAGILPAEIEAIPESALAAWRAARRLEKFMLSEEARIRRASSRRRAW